MTSPTPAIDLMPFCARRRDRTKLSAPGHSAGYTYASDGHIGIRVPGRLADELAGYDFTAIFGPADDPARTWSALAPVDIPSLIMPVCATCRGRGWLVECASCRGSGECVCSCCDTQHECGMCKGEGTRAAAGAPEDERETCHVCDGRGTQLDRRTVDLGDGLWVTARYLSLVQDLPGPIEWSPEPDRSGRFRRWYGGAFFRGPGWTAIILSYLPGTAADIVAHRCFPPRHACGAPAAAEAAAATSAAAEA